MIGLILLIVAIIAGVAMYNNNSKKRNEGYQLPSDAGKLLNEHVAFYRNLDEAGKQQFEKRVQQFLEKIRITGVGVQVEELDRLLVASGAIIPIFHFSGWQYNNINEVLLFKDSFNEEYGVEGGDRNILGMVGDGVMQRQMILSQPSLRSSFNNPVDGHNTAIHEFVHLLDKADGAVDGVPEYLLSRPYVLPWIKQIHETIRDMKQGKDRDINFYGATNDAEFFAVISEYFFERPDKLKEHHPELFGLLEKIFRSES
ncbi:MAG: zinc-dependent peptidase [Chitinophagaceae bacterium]